jgi:hypothetical protein
MEKRTNNPLDFFGKVSQMSFRQRKKNAIKAIWASSNLELPEHNLAAAVVSTAINDIREEEETAITLKRRAVRNKNTPPEDIIVKNSIQAWYDGDLLPWLNVLGIKWEYTREVFKHFKLLPKTLRPLWRIKLWREKNGKNK